MSKLKPEHVLGINNQDQQMQIKRSEVLAKFKELSNSENTYS